MDETKPDGITPPPKPLRVLMLEDSVRDAKLAAKVLEGSGIRVQFEVTDLSEVFRSNLEKFEYDVILADFNLRNWTALDALEILKQSGKDIPLIVVTGSLGDEAAAECIKQGAADFALKDRLARLPVAVQRALEEKRLREQHKHAERELRESEERYRLLFERNLAGVFRTVMDGHVLECNQAMANILGFASPREIVDRHVGGLNFSDDDRAGIFERLKVERRLTNFEMRLRRQDGSPVWVIGNISLLPLTTTGLRIIEGTLIDITARKLAESENGRLALVVNSSDDAIFSTTREGIIVTWNAGAERMFGYAAEEIKGKHFSTFIPEERRVDLAGNQERLFHGEALVHYEHENMRKDGSRIQVSLTLSPIKDAAGFVTGVSVIARDITERKRAEESLRESEERFRATFENAGIGMALVDMQGRPFRSNPILRQMLGYSEEEFGRMAFTEFTHPDDRALDWELYRDLIGGKYEKYEMEKRFLKKGGGVLWGLMTVSLIKGGDGRPVCAVGMVQDITERKDLEEQVRLAVKMEAVGRLAGGVAHDFNNLLTIINGYTELLMDKFASDDWASIYLKEIAQAGERAAALTRQLLAFSRSQVLAPQVLDLNAVVSNLEKMLRRLIGEDIELSTALAPSLGRVKADPGQIEQVIMNLVVNARDAMPNGGHLTIETSNAELDETYARNHVTIKPGPHVLLAVADTGVGMAPETQAHIFEPFFTTKEQGKGTGLGLATVYGIVKQSGGSIWVYSEVGQGSVFKIYLPIVNEGPTPEQVKTETDSSGGTETILVVEDEVGVRSLINLALVSSGYKVLETDGAKSALELCAKYDGPIHLLLTDVVMPQMSGPMVAERVATLRPGIKVLYMSGYTDDAVVRHGVLTQEMPFIQKPFSPLALRKKIRGVLGGT